MLALGAFIHRFEAALAEKNWAALAELDAQMQSIVTNEQAMLQQVPGSQRNDAQQQINRQLAQLKELYNQAEQLATHLKQQTGEQIQTLSAGKAGISAYQDNALL